jgi:hypothetical protein
VVPAAQPSGTALPGKSFEICIAFATAEQRSADRPSEMPMDHLIRFLAGGFAVSLFAVIGDVLRPKSFAGLFGAAPSVAIATLTLAFWKHGGSYVAIEGRSMILGAIALAAYSFVACQLLMRLRCSALTATLAATSVWLVVAIALKQALLG